MDGTIATQALQMRRCIETPGRLLAAIKHGSLMLGELREELPPKVYYERYYACFDALSQLYTYLREIHATQHLADIYEIVQYAGNIVPRLYLMITVGAAYMSVPDAPVTEIMKDMLEMCRGVQHPERGMFLRYYLVQRVRELLPLDDLNDCVRFIMTNFIETNKLWVRMQYSGPSQERAKRTAERKELRTIVGYNVVRLAELNVPVKVFAEKILPPLLEQIIQCRDPIAQEYLLDVVVSTFPADFHLQTLDQYLDATSQLSLHTPIPKVLLLSIDRLQQYFYEKKAELDEADGTLVDQDASEATPAEAPKVEPEAKPDETKPEPSAESTDEPKPEESDEPKPEEPSEPRPDSQEPDNAPSENTADGDNSTPEPQSAPAKPAKLEDELEHAYLLYWEHLQTLQERLDAEQRAEVALRLARFAFLLAPENLGRIHELMMFVEGEQAEDSEFIAKFLSDLLEYIPLLDLIGFGTFKRLLSAQGKLSQQALANKVLQVILSTGTAIVDMQVAQQIFDLFGLITKSGNMDSLHLAELVYLLQTERLEEGLSLLQLAQKSLRNGGSSVVQQTYGALVTSAVKLLRANPDNDHGDLLKFIGRTINDLATIGSQPEKALRLYLFAALAADQFQAEEASYEFFVQAFSLYEEHISDSRAQYQAICILTGSLQKSRNFGEDNYVTLASRCSQYGQKLLKKPDQCRAIYMAAHLWYVQDGTDMVYSNDTKVLETLQRALRVADACMDPAVSVELFVEVLNRYLYFLEHECSQITEKHVNGLIELIHKNLESTEDETTSESPRKHFERTLAFIESQQSVVPAFAGLSI